MPGLTITLVPLVPGKSDGTLVTRDTLDAMTTEPDDVIVTFDVMATDGDVTIMFDDVIVTPLIAMVTLLVAKVSPLVATGTVPGGRAEISPIVFCVVCSSAWNVQVIKYYTALLIATFY